MSTTPTKKATDYGRLEPTASARFAEPGLQFQTKTRNNNILGLNSHWARCVLILVILVVVTLSVSLATFVIVIKHNKSPSSPPSSSSGGLEYDPKQSLTRICQMTRYPDLCLNSLGEYMMKDQSEGIVYGEDQENMRFMEISFNLTVQKLNQGWDQILMEKKGLDKVKDSFQWSAHEDCLELIDDSVDLLTRAHSRGLALLFPSSTTANIHQNVSIATLDMMTWMTAVLTNQDTCKEGFEEAGGAMNDEMAMMLEDLSQVMSNNFDISSAIVTSKSSRYDVVSGRQLMGSKPISLDHQIMGYPQWVSGKKRELLKTPVENITANVTVSQDGTGPNITVNTIAQAIKLAPKNSSTPFIIHVKAGRYEEADLHLGKNMTNLWFIGDGMGKTIISGHRSVGSDKVTTYKTASFGVYGFGFVAKGITFENTAGPENHQAVALRVNSDQAVFYECEMKGYQDTLYVHTHRQFYRECDIYGTVDFIFGNAAAVFQNCTLYARKPMVEQTNTITAQKRDALNNYTGISFQACSIRSAPDLEPVKQNYTTYLGRPWRPFARVIYMLSYIGDHVNPQGWLPWNSTSPLDNVYYGEFKNNGPGSNTSQRIKAPGVHVNLTVAEANRFTVDQFEAGSTWIKPTGVPFQSGLGDF